MMDLCSIPGYGRRTRASGHTLKSEEFEHNIRKSFFTLRATKQDCEVCVLKGLGNVSNLRAEPALSRKLVETSLGALQPP